MAIEIVDLPIQNGGSFQFAFCKRLPEGIRGMIHQVASGDLT